MRPRRPVEDSILAFWAKVERAPGEGCWAWTGSRDAAGYGTVRLDGPHDNAHRVAWTLVDEPQPGVRIRHLCRKPSCVCPGHFGVADSQPTAEPRP